MLGCSEVLGSSGSLIVFLFFFCFFLLFFLLTMPQIKSQRALLNVNKFFMLLTQSEGYTEMTTCSLEFKYFQLR